LVAYEAGKFWEFHDLLFAHQKELTPDNLAAYAKEVGVNEALVKEALATEDFNMPVLADMAMGAEIGVRGTPAFFINGIKMSGAQPIEEFAAVLDQQMELAAKLQAESQLKGDDLYQALIEANRAILDAPVE
jgi:protein-disulfide isomerase